MTHRRLDLDDFGAPDVRGASLSASADLDAVKLDAFEAGYRDGWDDCLAAEQSNRTQIGADLARGIADLSFTYAEARGDVLAALRPFLEGIADQFLPAVAAEALIPTVQTEIARLLAHVPDARGAVIAAPSVCPALEALVRDHVPAEITILPEPAYAEGHVTLRFGEELREIDLTAAADRIATSIRAFAAEAAGTPTDQLGLAS